MARSRSVEIRRAVGRVQRLCSVGLAPQQLLAPLTAMIQEIVPGSNRGIMVADARLELANAYFEGAVVERLGLYLSEYYNRRERMVARTMSETLQTRYPTAASEGFERIANVDWHEFRRSDYYNEILLPSGMLQSCCVKLADAQGPQGILTLFRTDRETGFARRDFEILEVLSRFIAHGLQGGGTDSGNFLDTEDRALVVAGHDGKIQHMSADAHRLLLMALVPRWSPETFPRMALDSYPEIVRLCSVVRAIWSGRPAASPPVLRRRNDWGEFELRAYWLGARHPEEVARFIGITVQRREARPLRLWRRIEALVLTEREKQLCLLLARGYSLAQSAPAMGVSESTVVTHRRSLYDKLGVASRASLMEQLLAA